MKRLLSAFICSLALAIITQFSSCHAPAEEKGVLTISLTRPGADMKFIRADPRFDSIITANAKAEKLAGGYKWTEGPLWNRQENYLLFSEIPSNAILKWKEGEGVIVFMRPSGYTGKDPFLGEEPGTNGLTYDSQGRLVACEHGDRRVSRLEADGKTKTTLADRYEGKRLNSPRSTVCRRGKMIPPVSSIFAVFIASRKMESSRSSPWRSPGQTASHSHPTKRNFMSPPPIRIKRSGWFMT